MKFTKSITFDMDGTLADFYGVENWIDYLHNEDTTPYEIAKPLFNFQVLARLLNRLQKQGYTINIVSWSSKGGTSDYLKEVEKAKKAMEEGSDSSGSESVKTEEVKSSRIPSEITLREVKKKKSTIKKRSKKKEKLYLIGKELNDKIECIRQKLRRDEKTPIQISNYL